jgi:hypothetical protein
VLDPMRIACLGVAVGLAEGPLPWSTSLGEAEADS